MLTRGREAQARASPNSVLSPLPRGFVRAVFHLLPTDQRLRCVEVSRAWRALLADTSLWTSLDVSSKSGLTRFSEALFRVAVAKAGGQLRELNLAGRTTSTPALLRVLASNAASLELLVANPATRYTSAELVAFLAAAPMLSISQLTIDADSVEQAAVSSATSRGRLRLHGLTVDDVGQPASLESLEAFCTDMRKHTSLELLVIENASLGTAAAMRVLVNAAIELRLHTIGLFLCGCTSACVPELTRLVSAGALKALVADNGGVELFEAGTDTNQFCAAARASASLKHLDIDGCGPNSDAVASFIHARRL